jgi:hypothetical protein
MRQKKYHSIRSCKDVHGDYCKLELSGKEKMERQQGEKRERKKNAGTVRGNWSALQAHKKHEKTAKPPQRTRNPWLFGNFFFFFFLFFFLSFLSPFVLWVLDLPESPLASFFVLRLGWSGCRSMEIS